jgi:hypothetical protein
MTFLPIVERELRVAARSRWTFWLRVCAAGVALVIGSGFFVISLMPFGGRTLMGEWMFVALTWLTLFGVLSAGLFFTSDALSEEKREGTLGFLFLTDLRGYDVVLGKLLTTSLRGGFAVLAIFPVLAVTFMMGGVPADLFWKTLLALLNALFFSLAAGMFVSAISRDSQKAMSGTIFLTLLFLVGGPLLDSLLERLSGKDKAWLSLASPAFTFVKAGNWSPVFWTSLAVSHGLGWLFLGAASFLIPRYWQVGAKRAPEKISRLSAWWRYGGPRRRARLRQKFLLINPVTWLACRERWQAVFIWILSAGALLVVVGLMLRRNNFSPALWMIWNYVNGGVVLLLYFWLASQASRFFVDARKSGLVELLLATPLSSRQIVLGPWRAILRMFGPPLLVFLVAYAWGEFQTHRGMWGGATVVNGQVVSNPSTLTEVFLGLGMAGLNCAVLVADLLALTWFGLWMGMTSRSANTATLKTLVFVQIIPWFAITFATIIGMSLLMFSTAFATAFNSPTNSSLARYILPFFYQAFPLLLMLAKDFFFWQLSRRKLFFRFREMAAQAVAPAKIPRALPRAPAAPPPIPVQG